MLMLFLFHAERDKLADNVRENKKNNLIDLNKENEFKEILDRFYVPLCYFAYHYVEDKELAEDIVQECFIKLWEIHSRFQYIHQVKKFLYTSIRNKAINEIEHNKVVHAYQKMILDKKSELFFHDHLIEEETYLILTTLR